jgi:hypothetical protein
MVGGRKTHDYPKGKPLPLWLSQIGYAAAFIFVIIFGSHGWIRGLPFVALMVAFLFLHSSLIRRYERSGRAIPIARPKTTVVKFVDGTPTPILALRYAYFVLVALMILFGLAPFADRTARIGIIGCVLALFILAGLYIAFMWHYINTGRAKEIPRD